MAIVAAMLLIPLVCFFVVRPRALAPMIAFLMASVLWTKNSVSLEANAPNSDLDIVFFFGLVLTNAILMAFYALYFTLLFGLAKLFGNRKRSRYL